jgi:hypothetical protein
VTGDTIWSSASHQCSLQTDPLAAAGGTLILVDMDEARAEQAETVLRCCIPNGQGALRPHGGEHERHTLRRKLDEAPLATYELSSTPGTWLRLWANVPLYMR